MIPYGRQDIAQSDIDAVVDVLRSDFLTQGPVVPRFEAAVCEAVGARYGIAVNSGTSALHIACAALGLGPGDRLWTVPNTFVASANCARYCGADVDFVDIDPLTWNMSVSALERKLVAAKAAGRLPKIVIPVHFSGQPTEQEAIAALAKQYGYRVIEDASHAIGATNNGERVGSCRWSDITVFSFHPVKIVTTAEGGMAVTNDPAIAQELALYRSHGITRDRSLMTNVPEDGAAAPAAYYYEQHRLGFNYRMTDVHAALGLSQMNRLEGYVARRNQLAQRYDLALAGLPLQLPAVLPNTVSAFHLYVVRLPAARAGSGHRRFFDGLRDRGIGVNLHYLPVHLQPYYRQLGFGDGYCPEAELYARTAVTLPLFAGLTDQAQDEVVAAVAAAIRE
jgi:UDP-4-amino-4,6-dideoxy-N-acetyl-beta-L-altrosamine transaminase